jgi:hypothetical protein
VGTAFRFLDVVAGRLAAIAQARAAATRRLDRAALSGTRIVVDEPGRPAKDETSGRHAKSEFIA